ICVGEDLVITNVSTGTGLEYDWDFGPGVEVVSSSEEQYIIRYTTDGTKTISLTAGNILGDSNFSLDVTVNPAPTVSLSNPVSICEGEATTITATTDDAVEWNFGLGSDLSIEVNPSETTTYVATATNGFQCSSEASVEIEVLDLPNVNAGFDAAICFGEQYSLSGTGDGNISWGIPGESNGDVDVQPEETTVYTLTSVGVNGCVASDDIVITVNEIPEADAGEDQTICDGESLELSATGGEEYLWQDLGSGATQTVSPSGTTTYVVTVTNATNCSFVDQVTIEVNPSPTISVNEDAAICAGESISLEANGTGELEWDQGLGSESIIQVTPAETTTYVATATNEFQCSTEAMVTVEVLDLPEVNAGDDMAICAGESVMLAGLGEGTLYWGENEESGVEITLTPTGRRRGVCAVRIERYRTAR
ncbi:MAG: hypothetical protein AAF193_09705, partial [Bacteroidota bacterium]